MHVVVLHTLLLGTQNYVPCIHLTVVSFGSIARGAPTYLGS